MIRDRRTIVVLSSLVGAMTLASALLLALEPRPSLAPIGQMSLSSVGPVLSGRGAGLIDIAPGSTAQPWKTIVIHQTGRRSADPKLRALSGGGSQGLRADLGGDHFVIGNGQGTGDGEVAVAGDWWQQVSGDPSAQATGRSRSRGRAIKICLVGDYRRRAPSEKQIQRLTWLVHQLQFRYGISAESVVLRDRSGRGVVAGGMFPEAWFRQQLLASGTH